jgi:phenylalanine-4-hydroxylase
VKSIPKHLERYAVEQDYSRYTSVDQAVWRHIMRQLRSFLSTHAHECYLDGLAKTGIEVDSIPRIDDMNEKLEKFGWRALPVSGFIPPAAFMELQSLGILPIACDMRSLDHLLYTPAPDIVHEAAGHAPILVDPAFAHYLKSYAQVARKAILSQEDISQYESIRILSDVKEHPSSTIAQIKQAEEQLTRVTNGMSNTSEAAILGRMNWWTAEYGLIGDLDSPKIFGAGLLSSVGESRSAMSSAVKKIPLTLDCINYAYDITEQQPQLFVVQKFEQLDDVLNQLARQMAFKCGGDESLEKLLRAKTVNTIELDSGLQISGTLKSYKGSYLALNGPTQLATNGRELHGQGVEHHQHGFGSPIGRAAIEVSSHTSRKRSSHHNLGEIPQTELDRIGIKTGESIILHFESGVVVSGKVMQMTYSQTSNRLIILTLAEARATRGAEVLFDPSWGIYDMAVGEKVVSCYGGPADRPAFGETSDFTKKTIPRPIYEDEVLERHALYESVASLRKVIAQSPTVPAILPMLKDLVDKSANVAPNDWLVYSELLEIAEDVKLEAVKLGNAKSVDTSQVIHDLLGHLQTIARIDGSSAQHIADARKTFRASI